MSRDCVRRISRSSLEQFVKCPRCAYLKHALGLWPPSTPPFTLNLAVDRLLKIEFDQGRAKGEVPRWLAGVLPDVKPLAHPDLDAWRDHRRGVTRDRPEVGVQLYGAIDDLWIAPDGQVHVVDYKATGSSTAVHMDQKWHDGYRRQVEIYRWLLEGQGLEMSPVAYFLFCAVDRNAEFEGSLRFTPHVVAHRGDVSWVPDAIDAMATTMQAAEMPRASDECEECGYRRRIRDALFERGWLR